MNENRKINLGVCPIGKFVFSHEDALIQKKKIYHKLDRWKINYCTIEDVLPDGMVRDHKHIQLVVDHFKKQKIDALFIPHCNFGTEDAAGMIAKKLSLPTLLWGPRDEAPLPDGTRLRDSLCGMFATSKVLHKLKVPFTYIENCRINDDIFKKNIFLFLQASSVVKAIKSMRIGQIGVRIDFFWTTIINESELLDKFGIQVLPFDMADFLSNVKKLARRKRLSYQKELVDIKKWLIIEGMKNDEPLINSLALRDILLDMSEEHNLDGITIKTFSSIQDQLGGANGLASSMVCDKGIPIIDEVDIHGVISSILIESAAGVDEPSFFPEFTIRHPKNDNAVLLFHCSAPLSLRDPNSSVKMTPPWVLKGLPPIGASFKLKEGPLTVCRFDGDDGKYFLGIGEGNTIDGPFTKDFYTWMEVDNWPQWERKLIEGPYIHHCSAVYDHCGIILEEACKYIKHLKPQRFDKDY